MISLHFDYQSAFEGLRQALIKTADLLIEEYYNEINFGMHTSEGRDNLEIGLSKNDKTLLHREVIGGAWAILDSYGYGSKMDTNNPFLNDYKNSSLWNPARHGNEIVGRPKGEYTNIFGETATSSGRNKGKNLEGIVYEPQAPSKAFQNALIWFKAGNRIDKRIQHCIRNFNFSKYFIEK